VPPDQDRRLALELATIGAPFQIATCCAPASKVAGAKQPSAIAAK
jgi:hypothetical protein